MLRNMLRGICRNSSGIALVAGTIGVLVGVEHLLSSRPNPRRPKAPKPVLELEERIPVPAAIPVREDYFTIRRTRSELGYTYWFLQGYGKYKCYVLLDTWQQAMDEMCARTKCAGRVEQQLVAV